MDITNTNNNKEAAVVAIKAAFKELNAKSAHDDCVNKTFAKLRQAGKMVEKELRLRDGNIGKPDLTIVGNGLENSRNLCFIEIKCKNHFDQGDEKQAEKFRDAENGRVPVVLANMQYGKPEPNIRFY